MIPTKKNLKRFYEYNRKEKKEIIDYSLNYITKLLKKGGWSKLDFIKYTFFKEINERIEIVSTPSEDSKIFSLYDFIIREYNASGLFSGPRKDFAKDLEKKIKPLTNKINGKWSKTQEEYINLTKDIIILHELSIQYENEAFICAIELCRNENLFGEKLTNGQTHFRALHLKTAFLRLFYLHAHLVDIKVKLKFREAGLITQYKILNILEYIRLNLKNGDLILNDKSSILNIIFNVDSIDKVNFDYITLSLNSELSQLREMAREFNQTASVHEDIDLILNDLYKIR